MSFLFTWKISGRSRDFKLKTYPSIGYMLVYFVIIFMPGKSGLHLQNITNYQSGVSKILFVSLIYFSSFTLRVAIMNIPYSDRYKASWVYYIIPLPVPGRTLSGAVKALMIKFCAPILLLIACIAVPLWGVRMIPNLVLGISNQLLIVAVIAYINLNRLPFSQQLVTTVKGSSFIRGLMSLLLPALVGVLHYLVFNMMPVISILAVISLVALWLVLSGIKDKSWAAIKNAEWQE
jgi:hypothetical protein